jgi:hypothetical protein
LLWCETVAGVLATSVAGLWRLVVVASRLWIRMMISVLA